jgi:hypothetical protein
MVFFAADMEIDVELSSIWSNFYGQQCRGVCWDRWTLPHLIRICGCIHRHSLAAVFRFLCLHYASWSSGLPDLVIFHTENYSFRFVEVKVV